MSAFVLRPSKCRQTAHPKAVRQQRAISGGSAPICIIRMICRSPYLDQDGGSRLEGLGSADDSCPGVSYRWRSHMAGEGSAERACGSVADPRRDMLYRDLSAAQQALGDRHAPGEQIFYRRKPDDAAEPCEEGGA